VVSLAVLEEAVEVIAKERIFTRIMRDVTTTQVTEM
jgi:hypothetical protein